MKCEIWVIRYTPVRDRWAWFTFWNYSIYVYIYTYIHGIDDFEWLPKTYFATKKFYAYKRFWSPQYFEKVYWRFNLLKKYLLRITYLTPSKMEKIIFLRVVTYLMPSWMEKQYIGWGLHTWHVYWLTVTYLTPPEMKKM